jgi:hypothetical protein
MDEIDDTVPKEFLYFGAVCSSIGFGIAILLL